MSQGPGGWRALPPSFTSIPATCRVFTDISPALLTAQDLVSCSSLGPPQPGTKKEHSRFVLEASAPTCVSLALASVRPRSTLLRLLGPPCAGRCRAFCSSCISSTVCLMRSGDSVAGCHMVARTAVGLTTMGTLEARCKRTRGLAFLPTSQQVGKLRRHRESPGRVSWGLGTWFGDY